MPQKQEMVCLVTSWWDLPIPNYNKWHLFSLSFWGLDSTGHLAFQALTLNYFLENKLIRRVLIISQTKSFKSISHYFIINDKQLG